MKSSVLGGGRGVTILETFLFHPAVVFLPGLALSPSPEFLLLPMVITVKVCVTRIAR